jgi:hypothetical protein
MDVVGRTAAMAHGLKVGSATARSYYCIVCFGRGDVDRQRRGGGVPVEESSIICSCLWLAERTKESLSEQSRERRRMGEARASASVRGRCVYRQESLFPFDSISSSWSRAEFACRTLSCSRWTEIPGGQAWEFSGGTGTESSRSAGLGVRSGQESTAACNWAWAPLTRAALCLYQPVCQPGSAAPPQALSGSCSSRRATPPRACACASSTLLVLVCYGFSGDVSRELSFPYDFLLQK